jgi:phage terminase large subunit
MFWNLREEARLNPNTHLFIEVKSSTSGLLHPDELRDAKAQMTEDAFLREFECSFDASIPGAIWAREIGKIYEAGQVKDFPIDRELPVEVVGDLGYTDSCSWFVWQTTSEGYRVIDFYEANGQPISHYIEWIRSLPYKVADVWLPHDAKAKSLQTGRSMIEAFLNEGIKPRIVPDMGLLDGIEAARQVIPMCWFQETATYEGLEHLRGYSREWDERTGTFRPNPKHDSHSHASDAFRYMAIVAKKLKTQKTRQFTAEPTPDAPKQYQFSLDMIWDTAPKHNARIG